MKSILHLGLLFVLSVSCQSSEFKANQAQAPVKANTIKVELDCLTERGGVITQSHRGGPKTSIVLSGKVCPPQEDIFEKKTVLVLVDQSDSMRINDPVVNGSCGRLKAIEALVGKIERTEKASENVYMGIVGFETGSSVLVRPTKISDLRGFLRVNPICDYRGFTNYESVFDTASQQLGVIDGAKDVYLVSDGLPTKANRDISRAGRDGTPEETGISAARSLKSMPGVELFVLYLNSKLPGTSGQDPRDYLVRIAGGERDNVRIVTDAAYLVDEILKFDITPAPMIAVLNPQISLRSSRGESKTVELESIIPSPGQPNVWNYVTRPVLPFSENGSEVLNTFTVALVDNNGRRFFRTVEIRFAYNNFD